MKFIAILVSTLATLAYSTFGGIDGEASRAAFSAAVNGKSFELREDQLLRGIVSTKPGSMDGRSPARTVINATFNGPSYDVSEGRLFNEMLQFEMAYEPNKIGTPPYYSIGLQYLSGNYYMLTEQSKLNVTQMDWETDNKHLRISVSFNCKMRSWGDPADSKPDVHLEGTISNLRVTVPSWINLKN